MAHLTAAEPQSWGEWCSAWRALCHEETRCERPVGQDGMAPYTLLPRESRVV
jgi:hypothetical protein